MPIKNYCKVVLTDVHALALTKSDSYFPVGKNHTPVFLWEILRLDYTGFDSQDVLRHWWWENWQPRSTLQQCEGHQPPQVQVIHVVICLDVVAQQIIFNMSNKSNLTFLICITKLFMLREIKIIACFIIIKGNKP